MKVLHTSDWHVGKRIGRYDRAEDHRNVIDEVVGVADAEDVDLVLHSGDLFDRPFPPVESLHIALDGLVRLAAGGRRPVVVIAGNHDSPGFFEALAPFVRSTGIHLVGHVHRPDDGAVLDLDTAAGRAVVSCFPFLREGRAFHAWEPIDEHYKKYADRLRGISEAYSAHAAKLAGTEAVTFLVAHFLVGGAKVHGHGAARGERELHMGEAYAATPEAIPPGPQYVALGHIHAPQRVPGAKVPAEYAGSLLELDFGEAGEQKRVVVVDVEPGLPAKVRSMPLSSREAPGPGEGGVGRPGGPRRPEGGLPRPHRGDGRPRSRSGGTGRSASSTSWSTCAPSTRGSKGSVPIGHIGRSTTSTWTTAPSRDGVAPPDDLVAAFRAVMEEVAGAPA